MNPKAPMLTPWLEIGTLTSSSAEVVNPAGLAVVRCHAHGDAMSDLTTSRVNRAGQRLRRLARGPVTDSERLAAAIDTLVGFRALHAISLQTATRGLRSAVTSERLPVQVSQRLKRVPTILNKLLRANAAAIPNAGHRRLPCHFGEAGDRS